MRRRSLSDRIRLLHMRDACRRALEIARGKDLRSLAPEEETSLALVRLLEILGEAARGISEDFSGTPFGTGYVPLKSPLLRR